jgi:hypothetical protein
LVGLNALIKMLSNIVESNSKVEAWRKDAFLVT